MWRLIMAGGIAISGVSITARAVWPVIRPKVKGYLGERKVRRILNSFRGPEYAKAHDILIPGGRDTTQIDHVLVSKHGIFVIETKNYSGLIRGAESREIWTQEFQGQRNSSFHFYNPLMQNQIHIRALRNILRKYPGIPYYSIVAFANGSSLQPIPNVVKVKFLKLAIEARSKSRPVLTPEQIHDISLILNRSNITSRAARRQHDAKANLASISARNVTPEEIQALEIQARNSPLLDLGNKEIHHPSDPKHAQLTEEGAVLTIRGKTASIQEFFETSKRSVDDKMVSAGAPFDHFICPFTGDRFPTEEARHLYKGLWAAYFSKNPNLLEYLREHISEQPGGVFRCQRVLASYAQDPDGFIAQARDNQWYRNMAQKQIQKRHLNDQIRYAEQSGRQLDTTKKHNQTHTNIER